MSWTAYKKRLRPGAKLYVLNHRRPWRSRHVEIISRSKRSIVVKDVEAPSGLAMIPLPAAAFTRMIDDNDAEILAEETGPRYTEQRLANGEILAGMPVMTLRIEDEAPE